MVVFSTKHNSFIVPVIYLIWSSFLLKNEKDKTTGKTHPTDFYYCCCTLVEGANRNLTCLLEPVQEKPVETDNEMCNLSSQIFKNSRR